MRIYQQLLGGLPRFDKRLAVFFSFIFVAVGLAVIFQTRAAETVVSLKSGNWSDPTVWSNGRVPLATNIIQINSGHQVTYNVSSDTVLSDIKVQGKLQFSRTASTRLRTNGNILVEGNGFLDMGTPDNPIPRNVKAEVIFTLTQAQADAYQGDNGNPGFKPSDKGLWVNEGRWEAHGATIKRPWTELSQDVAAGSSILIVDHDVRDWYVGGTVVIAPTDAPRYNETVYQDETRKITAIEAQPGGKTKLTLDSPLQFAHSGTGSLKGEVGLLTRNLVFRTEITGANENTYLTDVKSRKFAHTMYHPGTKGNVQYTEFKHMGQYGKLGRYPMHPHQMLESSKGMIYRGNSCWITGFRCINLHVSHGVLLEDNVSYDSQSTPYFQEKQSDLGRNIDDLYIHNLAIKNRSKTFEDRGNGKPGDWSPSGFWFSNRGTAALGNSAVGSRGGNDVAGYHFPEGGDCGGQDRSECLGPNATVPFTFISNESHSHKDFGIWTWQNPGGPGWDLVDSNFWRNGRAGIRWGAYQLHHHYFNTQLVQNRESGVNITSVSTFLQDSLIEGSPIGYKIGSYVAQQRPEGMVQVIRNHFKNVETGISQVSTNDCTVEGSQAHADRNFAISETCNNAYVHIQGNTFENVPKPLDFASIGIKGNTNSFWRVFDQPDHNPKDFILVRKDMQDPNNRGEITSKLVNGQTRLNAELDALLTPIAAFPTKIDFTDLTWHRLEDQYKKFNWTMDNTKDYPPKVTLVSSLNGKVANLTATATDDKAVDRIEIFADWTKVAECAATTCRATVDLSAHPRRYAYLYARAFDGTSYQKGDNLTPYGQRAYSQVIEVGPEVIEPSDNPPPPPDPIPPTVSITSPANGSVVSGTVNITATAQDSEQQDNVTISKVDFLVDGNVVGTDTNGPYSFSWNTRGVTNGPHTLTAKATDSSGNVGTSTPVVVTVNNQAQPPPPPPPGRGDLNGDGRVNIFDMSILLSKWGTSDQNADLNDDGTVNIFDLSILLGEWTG